MLEQWAQAKLQLSILCDGPDIYKACSNVCVSFEAWLQKWREHIDKTEVKAQKETHGTDAMDWERIADAAMLHLPAIEVLKAGEVLLEAMAHHIDGLQHASTVYLRVYKSYHLQSKCLGAAGEVYMSKLQAISALKEAKKAHKNAAKQLKLALLHEDDSSEDEQERMQAQQDIKEKRKALKDASAAWHEALQQIIKLQQHFPEIIKEIRAGLPPELVDLWRPDLSLDAFESCLVLATDSRHKVYKAFMDGKAYALKEFVVTQSMDLKQLMREAAFLHRMQHPAIIKVLSIFEDNSNTSSSMLLQMPFFEHGTLEEWIVNYQPGWRSVRVVLHDVAGALEHLHSLLVTHCDVKPSNILITADCRGCLADFDISVSAITRTCTVAATRLLRTSIGFTPGYEAPELARYFASCVLGSMPHVLLSA